MRTTQRLGPAATLALGVFFALMAPGRTLLADWYVQMAAFTDRSALDESSERLKKAGYPVETEAFTPKYGQPLTRLLVGPFATKAEAEATSSKLAAIGWPGYLRFRKPLVTRAPTKAPPAPVRTPTPEAFPAEAPPRQTRTPTPEAPAPTPAPAEAPSAEPGEVRYTY